MSSNSPKRILIACGSALATSNVVARKLTRELARHGIVVEMGQCAAEDIEKYADAFDLVVTTSEVVETERTPVVSSVSFLTGEGVDETVKDIIEKLGG